MPEIPDDATQILLAAARGDTSAANRLLPLVYEELRRLASRMMAGEAAGNSLQPTALVHEAYLRLVEQSRVDWVDHVHFVAVAATMIRRILVDHARARGRLKRGGDRAREPLDRVERNAGAVDDYLALEEALQSLAESAPRAARVVELRYFGGLSIEETAAALGVSTPTVERDWRYARARLHDALSDGG